MSHSTNEGDGRSPDVSSRSVGLGADLSVLGTNGKRGDSVSVMLRVRLAL